MGSLRGILETTAHPLWHQDAQEPSLRLDVISVSEMSEMAAAVRTPVGAYCEE